MEFTRCKIVAIEIGDPREAGLLMGASIQVEDSRCGSLAESQMLEVEDARSRHTRVAMEDPRCQSLHMKW